MKTTTTNKTAPIFSLLLLLLLTTTTLSHAASEAEYNKVTKTWTLHADGSQEYRHSIQLTLFTHTAMNSTYGESFILYNPDYQELEIHTSYTRMVDGTIVQTPDNAFVEVLPRFAAAAPAYNHLKEMVVVHTGLELGATIHLDYSIHTRPGYYPALDIYEHLQETSPVKTYEATITVPEGTPLHHQFLPQGAYFKTTTSQANGNQTVTYHLKNVPATPREPFQPRNREETPSLAATTYATPAAAFAILNKEFTKGQQLEAIGFAEYITEASTNDTEKSERIRTHLAENMATSAVPLEQTGYQLRDMETTLRSAYGTAAEKAVLLHTMHKAAGIPADLLLIYPASLKEEVRGLKAIQSIVVKARINQQDHYLTATATANTPAPLPHRSPLDKAVKLTGEEWAVLPRPLEIKERKELTVSKEQAKDSFIICTLPPHAAGIDTWGMQTLNTHRTTLFEIPAPLKEEITYTLTVQDALNLQTPTTPISIRTPSGTFTQTITPQGDKIEIKRTIELLQNQYTPAEYKDVRQLIQAWFSPAARTVVFQE